MRLDDLDYELPRDLIAQHPAPRREDARLLVVERATGALHDSRIADVGDWLRAGDALVLNDTRVIPARLFGLRFRGETQVRIEATLHRNRVNNDVNLRDEVAIDLDGFAVNAGLLWHW